MKKFYSLLFVAALFALTTIVLAADEPLRSYHLGEKKNHPNGSFISIEDIQIFSDYLTISFKAFNGFTFHDRPMRVQLGFDSVQLTDDKGNPFRYNRPKENPLLTVDENSRLEGTIVFVNPTDDLGSTLTLVFNPGQSETDKETTKPSYKFQLALDEQHISTDKKKDLNSPETAKTNPNP